MASVLVVGQKGLPTTFSPAALAEAEALPEQPTAEDMKDRWDVRPLPLVTIDGETSRDFDDAVYAEPHPDGFRLVVAIADVAHYVRPGSALDEAALERTTSVYFPDRVLPMLPERVSNGLCSLNPHEDRLCMVAELIVRPDGTVTNPRFANGVMRSAARLTYTHVAAHLEGESTLIPAPVHASLDTLAQVYQALARARAARGALEFDTPEVSFKEQEGAFVVVEGAARNVAHKLIEECMIATNVAVAEHLLARVHAAPFRVHTLHSVERHDEFRAWSEPHGWTLPAFEHTKAADIKALLVHVGDHPLRPTLIAHVRRLQGEAGYTAQNAGHFGLALATYTHFTSPIRRYPDLLVHRALKEVLADQAPSLALEDLNALMVACVAGEKRAVAAERQVVEFQRAGYLATQVGHVFPGTVSNHAPMGVFVAFGPQASSMLGPAQLPGMTYDAATRTWRQLSGEPTLPVGQPIQVRLTDVDVDRARFQIEPVTPIA